MTRKDFLKTAGAAAMTAYLAESPAMAQSTKAPIRLSASLYCYNGDFLAGTMDLEACLADLSDMGAEGVEILPEAHVAGFPNPSEEWVRQWFLWLEKYKLKPSAYDGFVDTKLYKNRALTVQEMAGQMIRDIKLANRLGYKVYRGQGSSWPDCLGPADSVWGKAGITQFDLYDRVMEVAEKYDVRIGEEIHVPALLKSKWMDQTLNYIQKTGTKYLGFVPDMSIFLRRPQPGRRTEDLIAQGYRKDILEYVNQAHEDNVPSAQAMEEVRKMGGSEAELRLASGSGFYHMMYRKAEQNEPKDLLPLLPYIFHSHAKFYEVLEDTSNESSIPYNEIIPVLARGGYDKYLSSEYEGDRSPTQASQQIRKQHVMMRRMWNAA
jgi:sugar phosphate isomerase/epimerase